MVIGFYLAARHPDLGLNRPDHRVRASDDMADPRWARAEHPDAASIPLDAVKAWQGALA
jgi:hypothetical protein